MHSLLLLSPIPALHNEHQDMQMVGYKHPLASVASLLNLKDSDTTESALRAFSVCEAAVLNSSKLCSSLCCCTVANSSWIWVMDDANSSTQHFSPSGVWATEPSACFCSCCYNTANEHNFLFPEAQQLYALHSEGAPKPFRHYPSSNSTEARKNKLIIQLTILP